MATVNVQPGARVEHPKFGPGTVLSSGTERLVIRFEDHGEKKFVTGIVIGSLKHAGVGLRGKPQYGIESHREEDDNQVQNRARKRAAETGTAGSRRRTGTPAPTSKRSHGVVGRPFPRMESVTVEAIVDALAKHRRAKDIAADHGCSEALLYLRLDELRTSDPQAWKRVDAMLRTCACGRRRRPWAEKCCVCKQPDYKAKSRRKKRSSGSQSTAVKGELS